MQQRGAVPWASGCIIVLLVGPCAAGLGDDGRAPPKVCVLTDLDVMDGYVLIVPWTFPEPETVSLLLPKKGLPPELGDWAAALQRDDTALLYVLVFPDGPTQDELPMAELAAVANSVRSDNLITVIDVPTKAPKWTEVTLGDLVAAKERYELFRRGTTVFTSGPFEARLAMEGWPTFGKYLMAALKGCADANDDLAVTLEEAYDYAFWCTYAYAVKETGRPQTPVWRRERPEVADLVMARERAYFRLGRDPQPLLFAEASIRNTPREGPPTPEGPPGLPGPAWMSWLQGPAPREPTPAVAAGWAALNLQTLQDKIAELERGWQQLALVARRLPKQEPPSPKQGRFRITLAMEGSPGLMGPAAPHSQEAAVAREAAVGAIADARNKALAAANDLSLEEAGRVAQALERRIVDLRAQVLRYHTNVVACPSAQYETARQWPAALGIYPPWQPVPGPLGPVGKVPAELPGDLAQGEAPALWSPALTQELSAFRVRLSRLGTEVAQTATDFLGDAQGR